MKYFRNTTSIFLLMLGLFLSISLCQPPKSKKPQSPPKPSEIPKPQEPIIFATDPTLSSKSIPEVPLSGVIQGKPFAIYSGLAWIKLEQPTVLHLTFKDNQNSGTFRCDEKTGAIVGVNSGAGQENEARTEINISLNQIDKSNLLPLQKLKAPIEGVISLGLFSADGAGTSTPSISWKIELTYVGNDRVQGRLYAEAPVIDQALVGTFDIPLCQPENSSINPSKALEAHAYAYCDVSQSAICIEHRGDGVTSIEPYQKQCQGRGGRWQETGCLPAKPFLGCGDIKDPLQTVVFYGAEKNDLAQVEANCVGGVLIRPN